VNGKGRHSTRVTAEGGEASPCYGPEHCGLGLDHFIPSDVVVFESCGGSAPATVSLIHTDLVATYVPLLRQREQKRHRPRWCGAVDWLFGNDRAARRESLTFATAPSGMQNHFLINGQKVVHFQRPPDVLSRLNQRRSLQYPVPGLRQACPASARQESISCWDEGAGHVRAKPIIAPARDDMLQKAAACDDICWRRSGYQVIRPLRNQTSGR